MTSDFLALGVPAPIVNALKARRIVEPFPIQAATIELGLAGRDVCGKAPTGSGKTLAFGIPLVTNLGTAKPRQPQGLVLAPTRELADQIAEELSLLGKPVGVSVLAVYGGVGYTTQRNVLKRGVDIVVACPGRLEDLMGEKALSLTGVRRVVLDEADRMVDMGFIPSVRRILDACTKREQTVMFSATLDGAVEGIRRKYQHDPVLCEVDNPDSDPDLEHLVVETDTATRVETAAQTIRSHGSTIVFCRTKRGVDRLTRTLGDKGIKAVAIHGGRSQPQRTRALETFASGKAQALIATDVAARGIHIDAISCVLHYDPPGDDATYVHRSGRTGRAGQTGVVVSMVLDSAQRRDLKKMFGSLGVSAQGFDQTSGRNSARPAKSHSETERSSAAHRNKSDSGRKSERNSGFLSDSADRKGRKASRAERNDAPRPASRRTESVKTDRHGASPKVARRRGAKMESATDQKPAHRDGHDQGEVLRGSVKFYDPRRGYGFVEHGNREVFFHKSQIKGRVKPGQAVNFQLGKGPKGEEARDLAPLH